jgi:ABC-type uncharacterized transport system ATPase subunit
MPPTTQSVMHLSLSAISKRFGNTQAVSDASLEIRAGEILALLGENGAGKSTLMKLLYGIHRPDAGQITIDGTPTLIASPRAAMALGIGMVFQQFSLIPALSVRENLALVLPRSPWWLGADAARVPMIDRHLQTLVPEVRPEQRVSELSVGQMQLVELAKVLLLDARCVILDEPSAVLTPAEAQRLWRLMRALAARGLAVVLITHKLNDVRASADRVAVMRAGRIVAQVAAERLDDAQIVEWMVGHQPVRHPSPVAPGAHAPVRMWIKGMRAGAARHIDLQLRAGEIVGVAGVSGNGQTALAEAIAGVLPIEAGEVILDGETFRAPRFKKPRDARLGYIPELPLHNAVAPELSLEINLALKRLSGMPFIVRRAPMRERADALMARFDVRPTDTSRQARWLSGGNLQKLVAARELADAPPVVVACYPTMGLDIAACAQVYDVLFGLARQGSAVLWVSEDLDDLLRHAHRIGVMLDGRIVKLLDAASTSLSELGSWMTGARLAGGGADAADAAGSTSMAVAA